MSVAGRVLPSPCRDGDRALEEQCIGVAIKYQFGRKKIVC